MIDAKIKIEKKEAIVYLPLPENVYTVELLDINSENRATYDTRNKPKEEQVMETVLSFQFTLLNGKDENGENLRCRNLWENFVPAYLYEGRKGKNKLYQITEALLGHLLTQEEEANMDTDSLNVLVGNQCRITNKHNKKDDKIYDKIVQYLPVDIEGEPLNDEEREKAKVKVKEDKPVDLLDAKTDEPSKEDLEQIGF